MPAQTKPCNAFPHLKRQGCRSAGYTGGRVNIQAVLISWVYRGEPFLKFDIIMGKIVNVYFWWMVGFEPHDPNNSWSVDDTVS